MKKLLNVFFWIMCGVLAITLFRFYIGIIITENLEKFHKRIEFSYKDVNYSINNNHLSALGTLVPSDYMFVRDRLLEVGILKCEDCIKEARLKILKELK